MNDIDWHGRAEEADLSIRNFINGQYEVCRGNHQIDKYSPRDGRLLYAFGNGDGSEVERAVESAKTAFEDGRWRALPSPRNH